MEKPQKENEDRNIGKEWTTLSIRAMVRDDLKSIRDDLHNKGHKEFGYSDVIKYMVKMLGMILYDKDDPHTIGDYIIENLDELK